MDVYSRGQSPRSSLGYGRLRRRHLELGRQSPMYTNLDNFVAAAERLRDLRARGLLRFHVTPQGGVNLAFEPSAADEVPQAGGGLYADLDDAIGAIGTGTALEEFQRVRGEPRPGFPDPESPEVAAAKYEQLVSFGDELRPRVLLRLASRVPVLLAHDWEVVTKRADSIVSDDAPDVSYGLLRVTTERALGVNLGADRKAVTLGLDRQDVDELIEDLENMRKSLVPLEDSSHSNGEDKE